MSWICVHAAMTSLEAHVVRSALENHGIEAEVRNDRTHLMGGIPLADAMAEVWVQRDHREDATAVIKKMQPEHADEKGRLSLSEEEAGALSEVQNTEQKCLKCGEENPANFTECWNCQAVLHKLSGV